MNTRRLGFSFLYFTPRVLEAHLPWLRRLRAHGYDGAELPVFDATDSELAAMRRALDDEGLAATTVGFPTADANPLDPEPAGRRRAVEHLTRLAEKSAILGADVLAGPLHSAFGRFTELPPSADERRWCADVLREAGERAAGLGVKLAVEPLNRFECYFLNTAADCAALVREIGHPNVVGVFDTHHAHIEEDDLCAALVGMGSTLGHVQLSENHRGTPGRGQVDFPRVLAALDGMDFSAQALGGTGYRGWLVIEAFSRHEPAFGSALCIWRALDGGPEEVLAAGAALVGRAPRDSRRAAHD